MTLTKAQADTPDYENIIEMNGIVKTFPGVLANDHIDFSVEKGEILSLLGENGAGKTTLMNILYGLYQPDKGKIMVRGKEVRMNSPHDAMYHGIGMVHQHFMLVQPFTVAENIILGSEPTINGLKVNEAEMYATVKGLSQKYNLKVDPRALIQNIPVGIQQRVEILKVLYRGADILILDEPTAVLTPQEVKDLFETLRSLREQGKTIIIITHKLKESMALADRITVLRKGKVVGTVQRSAVSSTEELAEMMIGRRMIELKKKEQEKGSILCSVKNLNVRDDSQLLAVKDVSFDLYEGEILGIAGVVGNGQEELAEAICGLRDIEKGSVQLKIGSALKDVPKRNPRFLFDHGLSYIPEDRQKRGTIGEFSVAENLILGIHHHDEFSKSRYLNLFLDWNSIESHAKELVKQYDIRTPNVITQLSSLSGGNQQKVILAREISKEPKVIVAAQPTRGLDVGVIEYVHQQLNRLRKEEKAILLISSELDEILTLSDRIAVIYEGEIIAYEDPSTTDEKRLGLLMAGERNVEK